jgi:transglutaminase-like putative cysteine protease
MTRRSISLSCLLLCSLLAAFVNNAHAAIPIVHISAKPKWLNSYKNYDKQIPLRDVENGYFYQLLEEQINIESKADYSHIVRQIVSGAGIQNGSEISVGFDPTYERLDFHEIIVWRDNKPQNRLSVAAFKVIADETELSKFIYQGTYSAYCILKDIRKGDRIEYSYTITGRNPTLGDKYCRDIYLQQSQPIAHIYKSIIAAPARKLNFRSFNKVPKVAQSVKNGMNCYEWEDFQVKPAHDYENQPGWFTTYAYVQISDFANWNEVANWALKINPVATNITGALAKQIAQFKAEAGNDKEKYFRSAVKMVQDEVRYMGVEMGEYSHRANRPEAVYSQRYGDCKDKSLLLVSILNAGGIPASMVLINSNAGPKTDQYLPSVYAFDHATVVATINDKQIWVDPTIAYQRGTGLNLYYPDYGEGLVLKPDCNALTVIPSSKKGTIDCHENYTISRDSGKAKLDVITTYTLYEADKIRDRIASSGISETEKSYLGYYQKAYPKIESADSITIKDNEVKNELVTIEHYSIAGFLKADSTSDKYEGGFYASFISERIPDINTKLRYPRITYPCSINYTISAILPAPWDIEEKNNEVKKDGYTFISKTSAINDTLTLNYRFSYLKNFIPIDKIDDFATDVKQIKDNMLGYDFTYTPGTTNTVFRLNYWMVFSAIIFALILGGIFIKTYRTKTPEIVFEPGANFKPIGGWLILIAIGLGASVLSLVISLAKGTYFGIAQWNAHLHNPTDKAFKALFTFEAFGNVLLACYALFCFILLLKKRDILPRLIVGLYSFAVFFFVIDYIWAKTIFNVISDDVAFTAVRAVVVAAIWIPYFKRSTRVEETFIVPFPETNYRYEEMDLDNSGS